MKTKIFSRQSRTTLGLGLALLLGGFGIAQAQPSPVGTWDCALVSPWKGTAYLVFGSNSTINGVQIMTPPLTATNSYDMDHHTNMFGGFAIENGEWHFQDDKVVGFYTAISHTLDCTTTTEVKQTSVENTNGGFDITWTTNLVTSCVTNGITNSVSFDASVKPGKKINIRANVDGRPASLKGVPATLLPDISGYYYGSGRNNRAPFNEFFTLTLLDPLINAYGLTGQGPGYTFGGFALLSLKSLSFQSREDSTNFVIRAITGPINIPKGNAVLKGLQGKGKESGTDKITYKVTKQPTPPPPPPPPPPPAE